MALQSKTLIYIAGEQIPTYTNLMLHQQIDSHQTMELEFRMDVIEKLNAELSEESKQFLGERLSVQITSVEGMGEEYQTFEFVGIVTEVKTVKGVTSSGDKIVVKAKSSTFLADDGPHYASYNDVSLSEIVSNSFNGYDRQQLKVKINPKDDVNIHYSVQNNESAFNYVSRLAAQYGEWFYFNGKELIFGTPEEEEIELAYNHDLKEYHLTLLPKSHNYKFYTKDYLLDEVHEKDAKEITSGANGYNGFVANKAKDIFSKETKIWQNLYIDKNAKQRLDKSIENQKKAIEIQQVQLTGISDNPGVKLGNIVKVEGQSYRIISITHTNNQKGDYENRFKAITATFDAYPNTNILAFPKSESQVAVVTENADPEGLGRIKVQFPWQKEKGEMTPWIRIVTAHAGGDKGFHFIPELKEEVLIGFEGGNAEKPYMMGSLYHGNAKPDSWKTDKNDIKAIRTRSGHTIEFNDKDGEETIKIHDNEGSIIIFDTKNKSLFIQATEDIEMQAKNIKITAEENIELSAKKEIKLASEKDTSILSKAKITAQADKDTNITSKAKIIIEAKQDASLNGMNLKLEGKTNTSLKGGVKTSVEGAITELKGSSGKINIM